MTNDAADNTSRPAALDDASGIPVSRSRRSNQRIEEMDPHAGTVTEFLCDHTFTVDRDDRCNIEFCTSRNRVLSTSQPSN